jgi:hypothetical protein
MFCWPSVGTSFLDDTMKVDGGFLTFAVVTFCWLLSGSFAPSRNKIVPMLCEIVDCHASVEEDLIGGGGTENLHSFAVLSL